MAVDVTPLDLPPWRLRVEVSTLAGERATLDNSADALVAAAESIRVFVYAPRPSWPGTFVRRALENDSRFEVGSMSYPSRGIQITAGEAAPLQSIAFDRVRAIVVAGLDRLTAGDARVLERFMREREGSVALLPDSRTDVRAITQWLVMPAVSEVLLEKPAKLSTEPPLPSLAVSEMLTLGMCRCSMSWRVRPGRMRLWWPSCPTVAVACSSPARSTRGGTAPTTMRRSTGSGGRQSRDWRWRRHRRSTLRSYPPVIAPGQRADVRVHVRRAALVSARSDVLRVLQP